MKLLAYLIAAVAMTAVLPILKAADEPALKPYLLDYCVFTGDKLGSMGKGQSEVYKGQEIKFCCMDCKKQFDKDPAAGLKKYEEAVKKEGKGSSTMDPNMKM